MLEPAIQDKRRWWSREDLLLLILLGALFYLPGLGQVGLFDRDEPRFASCAREMLASGDYIVPHFNGQLRPDKPPLVYWLMTLSYRAVGGVTELGARLPSAIAGILTLLAVYFMVGKRFGRVTGLLAAIILGSCGAFIVESRLATADSVMLFFIVCCMACAWRAWEAGNVLGADEAGHLPRTDYLVERARKSGASPLDHRPARERQSMSFGAALCFWIALAAGALTKGVPLFFVLVPMVMLSLATGTLPGLLRRWREHFHLTAIRVGIALAVAAVVIVLASGVLAIPALHEARWLIAIVGAIVAGMILTPGLPGVLARCITGGNWRWWGQLRPLVGVPLLIALVGWWVILAGVETHWELIDQMVGVHFLVRVAGPLLKSLGIQITDIAKPGGNDAMEHYHQPPGFYLAMIWVTFWPWSILLIPAAYHAVRRVLGRTAIAVDRRPYQFLLAWIVPMWIILEISSGKLLHYPLPLYVPIAILCADAMVQSWHRLTDVLAARWFEWMRWGMLAIWLAFAAGVLIAAKMFLDVELFWRCIPLGGAIAAAGVAGAMAWNRPSWPFVTVLSWAAALLFLSTLVMPDIAMFHLGESVGKAMAEMKRNDPALHLAAQGFEQPTLVFYSGGTVEMPGFDEQGRPISVLEKIPLSPARKMTDGAHYVIGLDDKTFQALEEQKKAGLVDFPDPTPIRGYEIINFQRAPRTVWLVTNVPPPATANATATAATSTPASLPVQR